MLSNQYITKLGDITSIPDELKERDFDLQVKILQIFKIDEYESEIRVIDDSNEIWHTRAFNNKIES